MIDLRIGGWSSKGFISVCPFFFKLQLYTGGSRTCSSQNFLWLGSEPRFCDYLGKVNTIIIKTYNNLCNLLLQTYFIGMWNHLGWSSLHARDLRLQWNAKCYLYFIVLFRIRVQAYVYLNMQICCKVLGNILQPKPVQLNYIQVVKLLSIF